MKQIFYILVGLIGVILMSLARLVGKILSMFESAEQKSSKPWLENFVVLYINKCLTYDSDIIDLSRLSRAELDFRQLQSLTVYLKAYLYKIGETYEPSDLQDVLNALPKVWNIHATGSQSEGAVRAWCMDQNPDATKEELDSFINAMKEADKTSEDWASLSMSLLQFRFARVFARRHSEDFLNYTDTMLDDYISSREKPPATQT